MARTKADYLDIAEQATGDDLDARIEEGLVNDAGSHLFTMHPWPWAMRSDRRLSLVSGQPYAELPADFQQIVAVSAVDRLTRAVHETDIAYLDRLRGGVTVTGVTDWYVALEYPPQPDTWTNPAGARLAVYPTPSSDSDSEIKIRYRAGWVPLTEMDQVANIPADMEPLLVQIVRAFVLGYVDEQRGQGSVVNRLEPIENSAMVERLRKRYGGAQPNYGPMRGGIVRPPGSPRHFWHTESITVNTTNS